MDIAVLLVSAVFGAVSGGAASLLVARYTLQAADLTIKIEQLCTTVYELEKLGCTYWRLSYRDPKVQDLESDIKGHSKRVGVNIAILSEKYWIFRFDANDKLIELRRSITLSGFEEKNRPADPTRCDKIQNAAIELVLALNRSRRWIFN